MADQEIRTIDELRKQLNDLSGVTMPVDPLMSTWSMNTALLVGVIELVFCLVALLIFTFYAMKSHEGFTERYFQLGALIFIGGLAVFITVLGYSNEQMGAALGLLGTIAGYLLGKQEKGSGKQNDT